MEVRQKSIKIDAKLTEEFDKMYNFGKLKKQNNDKNQKKSTNFYYSFEFGAVHRV